MHVINSTRFRILISLFLVVIFWQVFRHWSKQDSLEVNSYIYVDASFSKRIKNYKNLLSLLGTQSNENNTKESSAYGPIVVMVFYEALCPDSKYFIIKQLQTAFYRAPALIDFQLIPYGKATVIIWKLKIYSKNLLWKLKTLFRFEDNNEFGRFFSISVSTWRNRM